MVVARAVTWFERVGLVISLCIHVAGEQFDEGTVGQREAKGNTDLLPKYFIGRLQYQVALQYQVLETNQKF